MMISVIVPAHNEGRYIEKTLQALTEGLTSSGQPFEVFVINNGSNDDTGNIAKQFSAVNVIDVDKVFPSRARNIGIEKSSGSLFAFVDGDTVVTPEWINEVVRLHKSQDKQQKYLYGKAVLSPADGGWIERTWFSKIKKNGFGGANLVISASLIHALAGFDETLETGEDYDLCVRAKKAGALVRENQCLDAVHLGFPKDVRNFCRREIWHGKGDCKDIYTFLKSPVALISILFSITTMLIVLTCIFGYFAISTTLILILLIINNIIILKRFEAVEVKELFKLNILNLLYFYSRAISPFKM